MVIVSSVPSHKPGSASSHPLITRPVPTANASGERRSVSGDRRSATARLAERSSIAARQDERPARGLRRSKHRLHLLHWAATSSERRVASGERRAVARTGAAARREEDAARLDLTATGLAAMQTDAERTDMVTHGCR